MADRVILIRHGQVDARYAGSYLGRLDVPLSETGRRQADAVAERLGKLHNQTKNGEKIRKCEGRMPSTHAGETPTPHCVGLSPEVLLASPLKRAIQTAQPIAARLRLDIQIDEDLTEIDFGDWSGKTFAQVQADDPQGAADWEKIADNFVFPGGESVGAFFDRAERAGRKLASHSAGTLAVVAHGGLIGAMICRLLRLPDAARGGLAIAHGSISVLTCRDGWSVLESLNDCCHLETA